MPDRPITLSVVSHGQNALVNQLLEDVQRTCADRVALVLTQNIPDAVPLATGNLACPAEIIVNDDVKGFGANHNAAFQRCRTEYFCVCNPDIRLPSDPFAPLLDALVDTGTAMAGPLVRNPDGGVEDSARVFPTPAIVLRRALGARGGPDYRIDRGVVDADWVAGMFMLFKRDAYASVGGFDAAYFLYYEDVDICARLRLAGKRVVLVPDASVIHDARRDSHRRPGHALRHARSVLRYIFASGTYRSLRRAGLA